MKAEELKAILLDAKKMFLSAANGIEISEALESGLIDRAEFEQLFNAARQQQAEYEVLGTCMSSEPSGFQEFHFMSVQPGHYMVKTGLGRVVLLRMR